MPAWPGAVQGGPGRGEGRVEEGAAVGVGAQAGQEPPTGRGWRRGGHAGPQQRREVGDALQVGGGQRGQNGRSGGPPCQP